MPSPCPSSSSSAGQPHRPPQGPSKGVRDGTATHDGSDHPAKSFSRRRRAICAGSSRRPHGWSQWYSPWSFRPVAAAAVTTRQEPPSKPAADANALKKGTTVNFWIMPNGPQPQADMEKTVKPFEDQTGVKVNVEVVGWDVQLDRIKNAAVSGQGPDVTQAGTTQVPFFAALGGFSNLNGPRRRHRRQGRVRAGRVADDPASGHRRHLRRAVVHRGAGHLLPQGRPEEGRDRSRHRLHRRQRPPADAADDQGQGARRSAASRSRRSACRARRRSTSSTT